MDKAVKLVAILIILLVASISGALAYNTIVTTSELISTPSPSPTVKPSPNPTVTQTPQPTSKPTIAPTPDAPTITPAPTTPSCKIAYYEKSRTYDIANDVTKIQIEIVIKTQGTSDGSYGFFFSNFYLSEYGVPVPNQSNNGYTSKAPLTSERGALSTIIFEVTGNYTSTGYQLSYDNFPIQASWSKEPQPINIIFF
jgi:hypothetical protein